MHPAIHDVRLVALSWLISILAACAARELLERLTAARGRAWIPWLAGAAVVDGIGTWSMHYTGKLALRLPVPVVFDWRGVVASLLVAILGSGAALLLVRRPGAGLGRLLASATFLGVVGISGLHYTAMNAMRLHGYHHHYIHGSGVVASMVIAVAVSWLALLLAFRLQQARAPSALRTYGAAVLRGSANPLMHYTAMASVVFVPAATFPDPEHSVSIHSVGLLGISIVPVIVLSVAFLTTFADRAAKQQAYLSELFAQAPQAIALLDAGGRVVRVNREFTRMFGYEPAEVVGRALDDLISAGVADEQRVEDAAGRVEIEGVRRRKDGSRLHVSSVRVPVAVPGGDVETYAIFSDITERRIAQEALRAYPRQLLASQEAERRSIARELHDQIGQMLTSVSMMLGATPALPPADAKGRIAESREVVQDLIATVRDLALDLRPQFLDDFGLLAALQWLVTRYSAQTGIDVRLIDEGVGERRFAPDVETVAFRLVQEALTNVARHAGVSEAEVRVRLTGETLVVEIIDTGRGFDTHLPPTQPSLGIIGMRERASAVHGRLIVDSTPGKGTRVRAEIPLS